MTDQTPRTIARRPLPPSNPSENLPESREDAPGPTGAIRSGPRPPPGAGRVLRPQEQPEEPDPPEAPPEVLSLADVPDVEAREGDVLVVGYPEVTLPLPARYSSAKVGGAIYTRRLVAGESAREQMEKIYNFLSASSERAARHKMGRYSAEFGRKGGSE